MKKNSILKVLLISILVVSVCTWIFPTIEFQQQLVTGNAKSQVGVFDLFAYLVEVVRYFPYLIILILSMGAFYGVAYRIPAYRALLDKLVEKFKGKENIFFIAVMVIISAAVSVTGFQIGMLFVFPFIISLILLMGYNKLVAASVTVGSVMVGLIGTTLGTSTTYYTNYILGTTYSSEIAVKIVLLLVGIVVLAYNVIQYAKKTRNVTDEVIECVPGKIASNTATVKVEKEVKEVKVEETKETKKTSKTAKTAKKKAPEKKTKKTRANDSTTSAVKVVKTKKKVSIIPFVIIFDLVFIVMLVATFDWAGIFNATWPKNSLKAVQDFTVGGFAIFSKILGSSFSRELGAWDLNFQMPCFIILSTLFLGFIYGLKLDKIIDGALDGMRRASKAVFYIVVAYVVLIVVTYHPFQLHFAKFFLGLTKGLNVITMTIVAMISSTLNVESIYAAQSTLPYVTSVVTDTSVYPVIAVIFQAMYGLMMFIAPTSVVLIGTLVYLDIPYTQWIKHVWKIFLELLLVLVIIFFIMLVI